jgi:hypothetical protein
MIYDPDSILAEITLAARLGIYGLFAGDGRPYSKKISDPAARKRRRERLRKEILKRGLAQKVVGRGPDGTVYTYSRAFERLYRQPL